MDRSTLSPDSETNGRSPEVSSTAFDTQPPDLQPAPLMDMGFVVICRLARHRMPRIWFLYIGSRLCSALLSDPPSPERPCASLSLSPPSGCEGDLHPRAVEHCSAHKRTAPSGTTRSRLVGQPEIWTLEVKRQTELHPARYVALAAGHTEIRSAPGLIRQTEVNAVKDVTHL